MKDHQTLANFFLAIPVSILLILLFIILNTPPQKPICLKITKKHQELAQSNFSLLIQTYYYFQLQDSTIINVNTQDFIKYDINDLYCK